MSRGLRILSAFLALAVFGAYSLSAFAGEPGPHCASELALGAAGDCGEAGEGNEGFCAFACPASLALVTVPHVAPCDRSAIQIDSLLLPPTGIRPPPDTAPPKIG